MRDIKNEGYKKGGIQERRKICTVGKEEYRKGGMQERWNTGK